MCDYKRDINDEINQEQNKEKVEWKSSFPNFSEWILNVQQFLDSTLVNDHLCDAFVLILLCNI